MFDVAERRLDKGGARRCSVPERLMRDERDQRAPRSLGTVDRVDAKRELQGKFDIVSDGKETFLGSEPKPLPH